MVTRKLTDRVEAQFKNLAADLHLLDALQKVRAELIALDDKCAFVEDVYGREHKAYRKVHTERDQALISADKLIQRWLKEKQHKAAPDA